MFWMFLLYTPPIRSTINQLTKESRQRAGPICEGCLDCLDKDNTRLQMEGDSWEEGGGGHCTRCSELKLYSGLMYKVLQCIVNTPCAKSVD